MVKAGSFQGESVNKLGEKDIRFTRNKANNILYAIVLGWPEEPVEVKSLGLSAATSPGKITRVELLGTGARADWKQRAASCSAAEPESAETFLMEYRPTAASVFRCRANQRNTSVRLTGTRCPAIPAADYCVERKTMHSPSSRYSAEQVSPPQIMFSPAKSWRRVISPMVPHRGHDITATYGFCWLPNFVLFSSTKTVPGSIRSGIHSSRNCKSGDMLPSAGVT